MTAVIMRFDAIALAILLGALVLGWRRVELRTRTFTLIALLAVVSLAMALGHTGVLGFSLLLVAGGALEFARVGKAPAPLVLAVALVGFAAPLLGALSVAASLGLLVLVVAAMAFARRSLVSAPWFAVVMAGGLLGVGTSFLLRLQALDPAALVALVLVLQFNDGFGYAVGGRLGRTRPFPGLSPGKSVEGYLAGLGGALVAVALLASLDPVLRAAAWPDLIVLAVAMAVTANAGDLLLSRLKRSVQVKDFGHLLPGHGGVLDRFDGWLLSAPVLYVVCTALPVLGRRP